MNIEINFFFFFSKGSLDPYCEITVGSLTLKTPFIKRTTKPKWNAPMQFLLYNLIEDVIQINVFDNEYFSPNGLFAFFVFNYFYRLKKKTKVFPI